MTLTSLSAGTLYHYRVRSKDVSSNLATSSDYTFTTTAASTGGSSNGGGGGGGKKPSMAVVPSVVSTGQPGTKFIAIPFPLGPSMKSAEVALLQRMLATDRTLYPTGEISGFYGPLTQQAVERFQIKYGLLSSGTPGTNGFGNVGPRTLAKLNAVYVDTNILTTPVVTSPVTNNEQKISQLVALLTLLQQLLTLVLAGQ